MARGCSIFPFGYNDLNDLCKERREETEKLQEQICIKVGRSKCYALLLVRLFFIFNRPICLGIKQSSARNFAGNPVFYPFELRVPLFPHVFIEFVSNRGIFKSFFFN